MYVPSMCLAFLPSTARAQLYPNIETLTPVAPLYLETGLLEKTLLPHLHFLLEELRQLESLPPVFLSGYKGEEEIWRAVPRKTAANGMGPNRMHLLPHSSGTFNNLSEFSPLDQDRRGGGWRTLPQILFLATSDNQVHP